MTDEQLTRLLAEKVMRWPVRTCDEGAPQIVDCPGYPLYIMGPDGNRWKPLERIDHAMALRSRFVGAGCAAWVEWDGHTGARCGVTSGLGRFEAEVLTRDDCWNHSDAGMARAFSLCALRAVGIDPEGSEP